MGLRPSKELSKNAETNGKCPPPNAANGENAIATTNYGKVAGKRVHFEDIQGGEAFSFLGIPFAKPPLGELRFRRPQPLEPWDGIRQAKKFPPTCPQAGLRFLALLMGNVSSEDCLYLNVFTPAIVENGHEKEQKKLLPVIVFIHGGAFVCGDSGFYEEKGICKHFVIKNGIVFVTIQYRVGPLGFFSTGDDACDDNVGLWDMTMALEWIAENIGHFGGDRHNVTLMGESAGGMAADLLALSPHSRDLFHKLIPMSGHSYCACAMHDNAVDKCREIAQNLGIFTTNTRELICQLRKVPAEKLILELTDVGPILDGDFKCPLAPRIDGKFFPKSLEELRKEIEREQKPRLVGVCQLEGLFFLLLNQRGLSLTKLFEIIARHFPEAKFPKTFGQLRQKTLALYLPSEGGEANIGQYSNDSNAIALAMAEIYSDHFTGIGLQQQLLNLTAGTNPKPSFLYSLDHFNPRMLAFWSFIFRKRLPIKGCAHGLDIFYFFKNTNPNLFGIKLMDREDEKLVQVGTKLWSNFAKFGDPNGSKEEPESLFPNFHWEPVSKEKPSQFLSLKPEPEMQQQFQDGRPMQWIRMLNSDEAN